MGKVKVIISPLFELWIIGGMVLVTAGFYFPMKISRILQIQIMWGKIYSAPKPIHPVTHFKVTDVHVDNRHHRTVRMNDNRNPCGKKISFIKSELCQDLFRCGSMNC